MNDLLIGKRISGRYKVEKKIGGGGMAFVYLAHDIILDRDVAVKVLRPDFANDEEFIRRFHREALSATSLAHPNIVNIYDVGEEDSIYYIVMEYVEGQTLKEYIQQNSPVKVEVAIKIIEQLASAMNHAHQNQIIHRDIKPQNILIDKNGNVKITDFGIAMALSYTAITQTNAVLGSVHYLSPEQARGEMATEKSDIYSLGIVMFELLTGKLPFSGETAISIALKHLQSETPSVRKINPSIPQSVENIVLKATAKDPAFRYKTALEMENDLKTALDPSRINEEKFVIPGDDETTKVLPVIKKDEIRNDFDETIVIGKKEAHPPANNDSKGKKQHKQKKKTNGRKKWPRILISIFSILVILSIFTIFILPDLLSPDEIEVPDVTGLLLEDAVEQLEEAGLVIGETFEINDDEIEEGYIVKTNPKAGKTVKKGATVDLYKSIGKEKVELGNYVGRSFEEVFKLLEEMNFKEIRKVEENSDQYVAGTIMAQSIEAGEEVVPEDTIIEFTVSKGPELVTLKDLTEYNQKALKDYEESTGLIIVIEKEVYHDTIEKGLVVSQYPKAGTQLKKGEKVTVTVSKGKEDIPPKHVTKEIYISYEPDEEGEPQTVQILIEDLNRSMTEPYQTFTITRSVTRTIELMIPYGKKAGYKVIRDDKIIIDEVVPYPED